MSYDNGKHKFSSEETEKGNKRSVLSRRAIMRMRKQIAKMGFEADTLKELLALLKVFAATPYGSFVIALVALELMDENHLKILDWKIAGEAKSTIIASGIISGAASAAQAVAPLVSSLVGSAGA